MLPAMKKNADGSLTPFDPASGRGNVEATGDRRGKVKWIVRDINRLERWHEGNGMGTWGSA
jgi:hypothetical protein